MRQSICACPGIIDRQVSQRSPWVVVVAFYRMVVGHHQMGAVYGPRSAGENLHPQKAEDQTEILFRLCMSKLRIPLEAVGVPPWFRVGKMEGGIRNPKHQASNDLVFF